MESPPCYNCQPYDGGEPVWLVQHSMIDEVAEEAIELVADVNSIELPDGWTDLVAELLRTQEWSCDECGTPLSSGDEVGEHREDDGTDVSEATHLLTQAYWPFLTHYTRSVDGLHARERLRRIISERRIRGSSKLITGGHQVVCFTESSPLEIAELVRVGTAPRDLLWDRGRWSLLGHEKMGWSKSVVGIAVERGEAVRLGARPVIHGERPLYGHLPAAERFRFVRFEHGSAFADWTFEREFRCEGDFDLAKADPAKVVVLVQNRAAQRRVLAAIDVPPWAVMPFDYPFAESSPWPRRSQRQQVLANMFGA